MPEPTAQQGVERSRPCARCHASTGTLTVRSEPLCRDCFIKYVATKLLKRLEMNKIRGGFHDAKKTLLIPITFDFSSISLLHALDQQLQKRAEDRRHAGYTLHLLYIDESCIREDSNLQDLLPLLRQRFPDYRSSIIKLEDCFSYDIDVEHRMAGQKGAAATEDLDNATRLRHILSCIPSATSKADIIEIVRRRLTAAFAKREGCDSILYGDSTTELAGRVLSETAKGRGGLLLSLTADNATIDGVSLSYPMRDLLQKELAVYCDITSPPLTPLIKAPETKPSTVSSKDVTIDGLMAQYFESVEENYPSIVANVVRTSSKLVAQSEVDGAQPCGLCRLHIDNGHWGGEQNGLEPSERPPGLQPRNSRLLCYGCARATEVP